MRGLCLQACVYVYILMPQLTVGMHYSGFIQGFLWLISDVLLHINRDVSLTVCHSSVGVGVVSKNEGEDIKSH